jgi:hypothetical protein
MTVWLYFTYFVLYDDSLVHIDVVSLFSNVLFKRVVLLLLHQYCGMVSLLLHYTIYYY